jgi:uncharacterized membrane protein
VIGVSNVLGVIIGVILVILGLVLLVAWWAMFIKGVMAILPILLILFGVGALVYFISEMKSKLEIQKENTSSAGEKKGE